MPPTQKNQLMFWLHNKEQLSLSRHYRFKSIVSKKNYPNILTIGNHSQCLVNLDGMGNFTLILTLFIMQSELIYRETLNNLVTKYTARCDCSSTTHKILGGKLPLLKTSFLI